MFSAWESSDTRGGGVLRLDASSFVCSVLVSQLLSVGEHFTFLIYKVLLLIFFSNESVQFKSDKKQKVIEI